MELVLFVMLGTLLVMALMVASDQLVGNQRQRVSTRVPAVDFEI